MQGRGGRGVSWGQRQRQRMRPDHEPLVPSVSDHIFSDTLSPSHYYSAGVDVVTDGRDIQALG